MSGNGDEEGWDLSKNGVLWATVATNTNSRILRTARVLVTQLQESLGSVDVLQGLLLDRIAAGYLRKQRLIEVQGKTWLSNNPTDQARSANLLRYEILLDQGFHRDLILLLQLQKASLAAPAPSAKKPPKSDRGLIEGQANPHVADQVNRSSAVMNPSPVAPGNEVEPSSKPFANLADVNLE
jgi:hypothetical protein